MRKNLLIATLVGLCVIGVSACSKGEDKSTTDNTPSTAMTAPEQTADQAAPAQSADATSAAPVQDSTQVADATAPVATPDNQTAPSMTPDQTTQPTDTMAPGMTDTSSTTSTTDTTTTTPDSTNPQ